MTISESDNKQEDTSESLTVAMDKIQNSLASQNSSQGFLPVLQNQRFLILWLGQVFSQLADKIYLVLMISLIATKFPHSDPETESISGWVSAIMISSTIPAVLFGSLAGVYVDRWRKKTVMVVSNFLRGILVLALPFFLWIAGNKNVFFGIPFWFLILLITTFVASTLTQFFAPAEQASIPLIVKRRHLLPANSLYTTTMMAVLIVGFAVGEPLFTIVDTLLLPLSIDFGREIMVGGFYLIAGIILSMLETGEKPEHFRKENPHVWQDIRDGVLYLSKNQKVRNALTRLVILFCVFAALAVLAVPLAERTGLKAEQFGFLLAAGGLGIGVGAGFTGNWGQRFAPTKLGFWGSVGVATCLLGLAIFTRQLWLVLSLTTILGVFAALVGVPMQTIIQVETPPDMRGKVFGLQNNGVNIALSLPLALAGIAETFLGLKLVLIILATLTLVGGLLTRYISEPINLKPKT
jgi:MFS family permease